MSRRLCAIGCSSLAVASGAAAAEPAPAGDTLAGLVVTAQRRPERVQEVPIFLTAASGARLDSVLAADMASLGKIAPSLVVVRTGAFTQPFLRGVGKRSTLGVENGVATYLDGVYLASAIGTLLDLRGVERVEVLSGPQGTLFGRNTTGGVIQIITREPTRGASGEAELQAGAYGFVRGDAYLTGGGDRLAGNLAVSLSRNGGYGTNLFTGKTDQGDVDHSLVARSKWAWRPADHLTLTLAGDYQDIDQDFTQLPVAGFPPIGAPRVQGFRDGDQDAPNRHHFRYGGASVRADAEVGGLQFMSLTAARGMHARYAADLDMGPNLLVSAAPVAEQNQFSQEFQMQSGAASRLRWTAGAYFIRIEQRYEPQPFQYGGSYSASLGGRIRQTLVDEGRVSSYAAYGQATWPVGEATRLTAGLRYTIEDRSVRAAGEREFDNAPFVRPIPGLPLLTEAPFRASKTFRELTWRAALERQFSAGLMGFLSVSRGFQSGGWNLQTPQAPPFGPERLDDLEAGLKYVDRAGRFSADASVFYYDYSDMQVSAFTPLGSMTTNAASADIYGADLQVEARLGERTDVGLGAQILEARYGRFPNASCVDYSPAAAVPYAPISCDATGNRLPYAPRVKVNLRAEHVVPLGRGGTLALSGVLAYDAGYFAEPDNVVRQRAFTTLDAAATWRPGRDGLSVRVWASNLTDARYSDGLATFPTVGVPQRPAAPRRIGASVAFAF